MSDEDKVRVKRFFDDLLSGKTRFRHQWNPLDPNFSFVVHRLVLKVLGAGTLIEWFTNVFEGHFVFLVRHPIAFALSTHARNWSSNAYAFLHDERFCAQYLTPDQVEFASYILESGSSMEKLVLEWCFENLVLLRYSARDTKLVTLTYEGLLLQGAEVVELLCKTCGFEEPDKMMIAIRQPSKTAFGQSKRDIVSMSHENIVTRWKQTVSPDEERKVQRLLDLFEIEIYTASSPLPTGESFLSGNGWLLHSQSEIES